MAILAGTFSAVQYNNWSLGQLSKDIHPIYIQDWSWDRKHVSCGSGPSLSDSLTGVLMGNTSDAFTMVNMTSLPYGNLTSWEHGCKPIAFRQHRNPEHIDYTKQSNSCRPIEIRFQSRKSINSLMEIYYLEVYVVCTIYRYQAQLPVQSPVCFLYKIEFRFKNTDGATVWQQLNKTLPYCSNLHNLTAFPHLGFLDSWINHHSPGSISILRQGQKSFINNNMNLNSMEIIFITLLTPKGLWDPDGNLLPRSLKVYGSENLDLN